MNNTQNESVMPNIAQDKQNFNSIYTWGANFRVTGKTDPQSLSAPWSWQRVTGTIADLANHLGKGHPFMPSLLTGNGKRWQSNANHATVLALDIDDGMTIEGALGNPFIQKHCGLAIETTSSKPDHHKFRLVFPLAEPIEGHKDIKLATLYLQSLVGSADRACSDASRFYFGSQGRSPFLLQEVCLPADFLDHARAWEAEIETRRERERAERERIRREQQARITSEGKTDLVELVELANQRLGADAFLPYLDHDKQQNGKWRCKPAFRVGSGSKSAFVGESHGVTLYHDPAGGHSLDGFRFFCWQKRGEGFKATGKDFIELAKEYCDLAGIDVPEWKPVKQSTPLPTAPAIVPDPTIYFEEGDRREAIAGLTHYRYILDTTPAGHGKSHSIGQFKASDFGASRLIYASPQHRNPTTPTLADGWVDLEGRHNGLFEETKSDGSKHLRRVREGEPYSVAPNCQRVGEIEALRAANIPGADTASLICGSCDKREECSASLGGNGYGFLNQRRNALAHSRFRCDLKSLPRPEDYNYRDTVLAIDESPQIVTQKTIHANLDDVARSLADCLSSGFSSVTETLTATYNLLGGKLPRYGLLHGEAVKHIPVPDVDIEALEKALSPSLAFLNPTTEHGVDLADLPKAQRSFYTKNTLAEAQRLAKQWLPDFLRVLSGQIPGASFSVSKDGLTIVIPDQTQRKIFQACKQVVILDATRSREDMSMVLGCNPEEIAVICQRTAPITNVFKFQITDMGSMTRQRGNDQKRRFDAVMRMLQSQGTTYRIDYKGQGGDGSWFVDNRGTNIFSDAINLVLVGAPFENLGASLQEYCALTGTIVGLDDPGFTAWNQRKVTAEINQAEARVRANLRRDQQINIYLLSDLPIAGWKQIRAEDVTPLAADKKSILWEKVKQAGSDIIRAGKRVTQDAIAAIVQCSQERVSQLAKEFAGSWSDFVELLILLLNPLSGIHNPDKDPDPEVTQTLFEMVSYSPPLEIFRELMSIFTDVGRDQVFHILRLASEETLFEWQVSTLQAIR